MTNRNKYDDAQEIEITREMLAAGLAEFPTTDSFEHDPPEELISWIYRAMFAAWRDRHRENARLAE